MADMVRKEKNMTPATLKEEVRVDPRLLKCAYVKNDGIPTLSKAPVNVGYMCFWLLSVLTVVLGVEGWFFALHHTVTIDLTSFDAQPDIDIDVRSCDVIIDESDRNVAQLHYWTFMGDASLIAEDSGKLTATALMNSRLGSFMCQILLLVPPEGNRSELGKLSMHVHTPLGGNVADAGRHSAPTLITLNSGRFMSGAEILINDMSNVEIDGIFSPQESLFHLSNNAGGQISISDHGSDTSSRVPQNLKITAIDSVVTAMFTHRDVTVTPGNDTFVELSGINITDAGGKKTLHNGNSVSGAVLVELDTAESAVLIRAVSPEAVTRCEADYEDAATLVHNQGAGLKLGPKLLAGGDYELDKLVAWFQQPDRDFKFVVNFNLLSTRSIPGGLKLFSSASYASLPLSYFSMISAGVMAPTSFQLTSPIVGIHGLIPKKACDGNAAMLQDSNHGLQYGKFFLDLIRTKVDLQSLKLKKATFMWISGAHTYKFSPVVQTTSKGKSLFYVPHPLTFTDGYDFFVANLLTIIIGLMCGVLVLMSLHYFGNPWIHMTINKSAMRSAASYRLEHTPSLSMWTVSVALISWPLHGIVLRWGQRVNANLVIEMRIVAKKSSLDLKTASMSDHKKKELEATSQVTVRGVSLAGLPDYPEVTGQKCFLIVVNPNRKKVGQPFFSHKFYGGLWATGALQHGTGQPALEIGEKYTVQVQSYGVDACGMEKMLEASDWTREVHVRAPTAFVEIPLLLWKSLAGILPPDSFEHFLSDCLQPVGPSPSLMIKLKNIKLAVVHDTSPGAMFAGDWGGYGAIMADSANTAEKLYDGVVGQYVKIAVSTGMTADSSTMYAATTPVPLPTQNNRKLVDFKALAPTVKQDSLTVPADFKRETGSGKKQFVTMDWTEAQEEVGDVILRVGSDLTQMVNFEAVVMKGSIENEHTACFMCSWLSLLDMLCANKYEGIADGIILNDNMTSVGILTFDVVLHNSEFGASNFCPVQKIFPKTVPDVFRKVCPGSSLLYGEPMTLTWDTPTDLSKLRQICKEDTQASIVVVSHGHLPEHWHAEKRTKELQHHQVITKLVDIDLASDTRAEFTVCPMHIYTVQLMKCHFELRTRDMSHVITDDGLFQPVCGGGLTAERGITSKDKRGKSCHFCVSRPVTQQTLEIGYATFCALNGIPMDRVPSNIMTAPEHGIELTEKRFYQIKNFRTPLPIPMEEPDRKDVVSETNGPGVVQSQGCILIVPKEGMLAGSQLEALDVDGKSALGSSFSRYSNTFNRYSNRIKQRSTKMARQITPTNLTERLLSTDEETGVPVPEESSGKVVKADLKKMNISTNVFWNFDKDWSKEPLLSYEFNPGSGIEEMLMANVKRTMQSHRGSEGKDHKVQFLLFTLQLLQQVKGGICKFLMLLGQLLVMILPSVFIVCFWVLKDYVACLTGEPLHDKAHLIGFLASPSQRRWGGLSGPAQIVTFGVGFYTLILLMSIFYCNFCYDHVFKGPLATVFNRSVGVSYFIVLCGIILYITILLVWVIAGGLLNPTALLPYVLMIVGAIGISYSIYSQMTTMRDYVWNEISSKVAVALHAVMQMFTETSAITTDTAAAEAGIEALSTKAIVSMISQEADLLESLVKDTGIGLETTGGEIAALTGLRNSTRFQLCVAIEGAVANRTVCTDFVELDVIAKAQELANREASLTGTRMGMTQMVQAADGTVSNVITGNQDAVPDEEITYKEVVKAGAQCVRANLEKPGVYSAEEQGRFAEAASTMNLSVALIQQTRDAFFVAMAETEQAIPQMQDWCQIASIFSDIRAKHLFEHFKCRTKDKHELAVGDAVYYVEKSKSPTKEQKAEEKAKDTPEVIVKPIGEVVAMDGSTLTIKDQAGTREIERATVEVAEQTSSALQMLRVLEQDDIEGNLAVRTQTALTAKVNWAGISAGVALYLNEKLPMMFHESYDETSNPCTIGGAALELSLKARELAFATGAVAKYEDNPAQIFVDCGAAENPTGEFKTKVQECRNFFQAGLPCVSSTYVKLVNAMLMPESAIQWEGADVNATSYFWYKAMHMALEDMGWTEDELQEDWLKRKWAAACKSGGDGWDMYGYENYSGISVLFNLVTGGGLWKAVLKSLMLHVGLGGYLICDAAGDKSTDEGVEECAKMATTISLCNKYDINMLSKHKWPDWVETLWEQHAEADPEGGPKLMAPAHVIPFLQDIFYKPPTLPIESQPKEKNYMNCAAANFVELQWYLDGENNIWNTWEGGVRSIRGLPYEVCMEMVANSPAVPSDPRIYYSALKLALMTEKKAGGATKKVAPLLSDLQTFLKLQFVDKDDYCTFDMFSIMIRVQLKCNIPETELKDKIFSKCPCVKNDPSMMQRSLKDLGAALMIWSGLGLWPEAIAEVVKEVIPLGPIQKLALSNLQDEFDKLDPDQNGILQPAAAVILVRKLAHPGLTFDNLAHFMNIRLGLSISARELHAYFSLLDMQGDGVITVDEFLPMLHFLVLDVFPMHILASMGLSTSSILKYLLIILIFLGLIFTFISLVMSIFSAGGSVFAAIQSGVTGMTVFMSQQMSQPKMAGGAKTLKDVEERMNKVMLDVLAVALGLSTGVVQKMQKSLHELGQL